MKYFLFVIITAVIFVIVGALFLAGSPQEERKRQFDEKRTNDLQYLSEGIISYWRIHKTVPDNLDQIEYSQMVRDPETDMAYGYEKISTTTFKLCATFQTANQTAERGRGIMPGYADYSWAHAAGYTCFDREIHPELFVEPKQ